MSSSSSDNSRLTPGKAFATTSWSMVLKAADTQSPDTEAALTELCEIYWYPLYAFVRRKGYSRDHAEDLTQAFFVELLEKRRLRAADADRGKFRSFLLTALDHFVANQWRAEKAQKRGGGQPVISIDFEQADQRYKMEPSHELTAERIFERNWALAVLSQALSSVQQQYELSGKGDLFGALKGYLSGDASAPYREIAQQLQMREGAIKVAVHRLRERYGEQLRLQIARTLEDVAYVDDELTSLFNALKS